MIVESVNGTDCMFKTLVKKSHKYGEDPYIIGKLAGYHRLICDGFLDENRKTNSDFIGIMQTNIPEGLIVITRCTPEDYDKFTKLVQRDFPKDLCTFNWSRETK